jgi:hypothetical protein
MSNENGNMHTKIDKVTTKVLKKITPDIPGVFDLTINYSTENNVHELPPWTRGGQIARDVRNQYDIFKKLPSELGDLLGDGDARGVAEKLWSEIPFLGGVMATFRQWQYNQGGLEPPSRLGSGVDQNLENMRWAQQRANQMYDLYGHPDRMPSGQREQYESLKWQEKKWREESKMADDQGRGQNAFDLYKNSKAIFDNYLPYITNQPSSELQPWFGKDYFNNLLSSSQDIGWSFSPYQQTEPDQTSFRKEELYNMLVMAMEERKQLGTNADSNLVQLASNDSYIPFTSPQLAGLDNYPDMGGFSYPEPPPQLTFPELPNDNIDGWDVSHMIDPNIPWYATPSYSSPQSDSSSQKPQLSPIDYAGSVILPRHSGQIAKRLFGTQRPMG